MKAVKYANNSNDIYGYSQEYGYDGGGVGFLTSSSAMRVEEGKPPPVVVEYAERIHAEKARGTKLRERDVDDRLSYLCKRI